MGICIPLMEVSCAEEDKDDSIPTTIKQTRIDQSAILATTTSFPQNGENNLSQDTYLCVHVSEEWIERRGSDPKNQKAGRAAGRYKSSCRHAAATHND
jgi:hypothetical protein